MRLQKEPDNSVYNVWYNIVYNSPKLRVIVIDTL